MAYQFCDDVIAIREVLFKHEMKATVNKQGLNPQGNLAFTSRWQWTRSGEPRIKERVSLQEVQGKLCIFWSLFNSTLTSPSPDAPCTILFFWKKVLANDLCYCSFMSSLKIEVKSSAAVTKEISETWTLTPQRPDITMIQNVLFKIVDYCNVNGSEKTCIILFTSNSSSSVWL